MTIAALVPSHAAVIAMVVTHTWAQSAAGQIAPLPPFAGLHREGFEDYGVQIAQELPAFNYLATVRRIGGMQGIMISQSLISAWGTKSARTGVRFLSGGFSVTLEWEFDRPVRRFGGYFGSLYPESGATAEFYDSAGALIAVMPVAAPTGSGWAWDGWEAPGAGFTRLRLVPHPPCCGLTYSGIVMHDDLELDFVPCYPDCNASGTLTVADFSCFQARFAAGNPAADCNASGLLTIADFACFQSKFVAGCP